MSTQESSKDREWEHWPGRRHPEEGLKGRLRALFAPGEEGEAIEKLAERGRELDAQTENLAATISDLERREQKTRELRAAVEDMLRQGSAELDDRHEELNVLAVDLARREEAVARAEADIAERRSEAGAVELRRAAVERREAAVGEREGALDRIAAELQDAEHQLRARERAPEELEQREAALDAREAALAAREQSLDGRTAELDIRDRLASARAAEIESIREAVAAAEAAVRERESRLSEEIEPGAGQPPPAEEDVAEGHVCFVPGERYRIVAADGAPPERGATLEVDELTYRVIRVGASPLPGDRRRCAFLEAAEPEAP